MRPIHSGALAISSLSLIAMIITLLAAGCQSGGTRQGGAIYKVNQICDTLLQYSNSNRDKYLYYKNIYDSTLVMQKWRLDTLSADSEYVQVMEVITLYNDDNSLRSVCLRVPSMTQRHTMTDLMVTMYSYDDQKRMSGYLVYMGSRSEEPHLSFGTQVYYHGDTVCGYSDYHYEDNQPDSPVIQAHCDFIYDEYGRIAKVRKVAYLTDGGCDTIMEEPKGSSPEAYFYN